MYIYSSWPRLQYNLGVIESFSEFIVVVTPNKLAWVSSYCSVALGLA